MSLGGCKARHRPQAQLPLISKLNMYLLPRKIIIVVIIQSLPSYLSSSAHPVKFIKAPKLCNIRKLQRRQVRSLGNLVAFSHLAILSHMPVNHTASLPIFSCHKCTHPGQLNLKHGCHLVQVIANFHTLSALSYPAVPSRIMTDSLIS